MQRLFVYRTLAPGRANHHVLAGIPGTWEVATLRGELIEKGWGAAMGYPGIISALCPVTITRSSTGSPPPCSWC